MKRLAFLLLLAGCGEMTTTGTQPDGPTGVQATFTSLYGNYLGNCAECHAPGAPGRTSDIEQTLDFSSRGTAYMTITMGMASGLQGNFAGCNMVPFILDNVPAHSLLLASIDQPTRQVFDDPDHPDCDVDAISDQTLKVGSQPSSAFIAALKSWIQQGAPNN
jgi:hypothetical protein